MNTLVAVATLTDREFGQIQELVYREAGIFLSKEKKALVVARLGRRLRELQIQSFGEYYSRAHESNDERRRLLDAICTNETHFFREPRQFEFLERQIIPAWRREASAGRRRRCVRVWSAACSTGEEPFSIAMLLRYALPSDWAIELLASDLSTQVLARAQAAVWPIARSEEIPPVLLKAFMLRGVEAHSGLMKASSELRSLATFRHINLNDERYDVGQFDLVFCRNVLMYFSDDSRTRVILRLLKHLTPSGYLFLGHAESLNRVTDRVKNVGPTVYAHADQDETFLGAAG
ncbi:MAG TPA: protein-glutamate O-methyltransferase CheR [Thermoanaerobaculia bacterium]|nr:protein-glutamate O-methyltransferase CheR [Thermoanaerobaculia bacterium]